MNNIILLFDSVATDFLLRWIGHHQWHHLLPFIILQVYFILFLYLYSLFPFYDYINIIQVIYYDYI